MNFGLPGINANHGTSGASEAIDVRGNYALRKITLSDSVDVSERAITGFGENAQGQRDAAVSRSIWIEMDAFQPGIVTRETPGGTISFTREYLEQKIQALYALGLRRFILQSVTINGRTYTQWANGYPIDADGTQNTWWYGSIDAAVKPNCDNFDVLECFYDTCDRLEGASVVVGFGQHGDPLLLQDIYNVVWSGGPLGADPMRFGITVAARMANENVRYQSDMAHTWARFGGRRSQGGVFIGHETIHLQSSALLYGPIVFTSGSFPSLSTYGCDIHFAAFHCTDLANTDAIANALIDSGATWVWVQTSAGYGYRYATGLNCYIGSITVAAVATELVTWRAVFDRARTLTDGAYGPLMGVECENFRIGVPQTATLTLSTTTVGTGRTVSSSAPISPIWVVGQEINGRAAQPTGLATITSVTDSQNCTVSITEAFGSTTVGGNAWSLVDSTQSPRPALASEMLTEMKTEALYCDDIGIYAEPYFDPAILSLRLTQSQGGNTTFRTDAESQWNTNNTNQSAANRRVRQAGWDVSGYIGAASISLLPMASGGVINFNSGDVAITHLSDLLTFTGASGGYAFDALIWPGTNDGAALGSGSFSFSDLFLASGGVINWSNGTYTLTQSGATLTASGAFSVGTSNSITAGTIELGAATDTTLSRSSAGVLAVEGVTVSLNSTAATHTAGTIELGAATDTTLSRSSAGNLAVEGNLVYRAGGTDVPVADGGTGASTAQAAVSNLEAVWTAGQSGAAASVTGTTTETVLATIAIPAAAMGANGLIEVTTLWSHTNSVNNKTMGVRFGATGAGTGATSMTAVVTTLFDTSRLMTTIWNANSASSQVGFVVANGGFGGVAAAAATAAINTANASDIVITGTLANSGETITLLAYTVTVSHRA